MSNPKRVWDSKKRAVRQWKEQVWLVDWEKKVNTNHWFAEATWEDVVYDSSWEEAQTPLQTYENWWSEDVPSGSSITINTTLSQATGEVGSQISIYLLCENAITLSDPAPVLEFVELVQETWEWYNKIAKYRVVAPGTKTLTFSDNITWDSDSMEVTCSSPLIVHYNLRGGSRLAVESDYPSLRSIGATPWPASDVPCTWFWNNKYMYTNNLFDGQGFSGNEDFTISFWANPTSFATYDEYYNFISIGAIWDYSNICLFWHSGEFYYGWYHNDTATWVTINTGEWTHIAMTYNSSDGTTTVYQNGVKQYEGTANYNIANGWHLVIWAGLSHNNGQLDGYMNEVLIAKQVYSDQDIADIYSNGLSSHTYIWIKDVYTNSIYVWDSDQTVMDFNYSTMANDITDVVYVIDEPWVATWEVVDQWSDLANLDVTWVWATNDAVIQVVTHWTNEVTGLASICSWILTHLQIEIPPIQSISSLSANSVSIFEQQYDSSITFSYTPTISTDDSNVTYDTTDSSVAYIEGISYEAWTATVNIQAWNTWTCTLTISCWIDTLTLAVTVNPYVATSVSNLSASSITL